MKWLFSRIANNVLPAVVIVVSTWVIFRTESSDVRTAAGIALLSGIFMVMAIWERRRHYKYRRLYRYERGRRIATDEAFHLLRSQFDTEIIESMAALPTAEPKEDMAEGEPTEDYLRGYVQGLLHGRELIPMESALTDNESSRAVQRSRHLKLVKSSET
jgi:hypothetical protein